MAQAVRRKLGEIRRPPATGLYRETPSRTRKFLLVFQTCVDLQAPGRLKPASAGPSRVPAHCAPPGG